MQSEWINKLRERAGYAAGEDRSKKCRWRSVIQENSYCSGKGGGYSADGAIYSDANTYYESNNMEGQETTVFHQECNDTKQCRRCL